MIHTANINLLDLEMSIATAIDLVSPLVANHHKRVTYIALAIAGELGLSSESKNKLLLSGLVHDIGALTAQERVAILQFDGEDEHLHAEIAFHLLSKFRHFHQAAEVVRFHHVPWAFGGGQRHGNLPVPLESHVLHLADRIDALIDKNRPPLDQAHHITATIAREAGSRFAPPLVEAFTEVSAKEFFWLELFSPGLDEALTGQGKNLISDLDWDDINDFAEMLAHVIDFRSHFTATHSSGVSAVAAVLAREMGFSEIECEKIKVAGYLHDVGKLAVPTELLEKPARLNDSEFRSIKTHAYHTFRILERIKGLEEVAIWAALHHERLDGNGYPSRRPGHTIPLGARVMAVADVFTALSERRPYREAADPPEMVETLRELVEKRALDRTVVEALLDNYTAIDRHRDRAQEAAAEQYRNFTRGLTNRPQMIR